MRERENGRMRKTKNEGKKEKKNNRNRGFENESIAVREVEERI